MTPDFGPWTLHKSINNFVLQKYNTIIHLFFSSQLGEKVKDVQLQFGSFLIASKKSIKHHGRRGGRFRSLPARAPGWGEGGAEGGGAILPENGRHGGRPRSGVPREENARETADPEKLNV